ncbi:hypothetical protein OROHE_013135 [Orobanche hederae]
MGSSERSRKKVHAWKRAIFHFLLCFVMGFFTGFAPINKTSSVFSSRVAMSIPSGYYSPQPVEMPHQMETQTLNKSKEIAINPEEEQEKEIEETNAKRLVIIVTPTSVRNRIRGVLLTRLANTLKLVARPLLWIVVEHKSGGSKVSEILRRTGIMYRHVVFKENFTDVSSEMDHQRNNALSLIEHHRLSGIVHFAGLSNVYDLGFFEEMREIEAFGAWPMAKLSAKKKRVTIEGPVCDSSEVVGWHLKKMNNLTDTRPPPLHISSFAFNSSILWDPERWGRTSSVQDTSQNSLRFVRKEVLEGETKLRGIPAQDCTKVLLWALKIF